MSGLVTAHRGTKGRQQHHDHMAPAGNPQQAQRSQRLAQLTVAKHLKQHEGTTTDHQNLAYLTAAHSQAAVLQIFAAKDGQQLVIERANASHDQICQHCTPCSSKKKTWRLFAISVVAARSVSKVFCCILLLLLGGKQVRECKGKTVVKANAHMGRAVALAACIQVLAILKFAMYNKANHQQIKGKAQTGLGLRLGLGQSQGSAERAGQTCIEKEVSSHGNSRLSMSLGHSLESCRCLQLNGNCVQFTPSKSLHSNIKIIT